MTYASPTRRRRVTHPSTTITATLTHAVNTPAAPAIEARAIACRRGERRLFVGLNLRLLPGELLWLRGDNGRGKTSLLRLLAGLTDPDEGDVHWAGRRARSADARAWQPLYVAHANALKDELTAHEALLFLARTSSQATDASPAAVDAALDRLGMTRARDAMVRTLSQGQRRRVALARLAMPTRARVWLLDEPYDALDQASINVLDSVLRHHLQQGGAVVLTSHQPLGPEAPAHHEFSLAARGATWPAAKGAQSMVDSAVPVH